MSNLVNFIVGGMLGYLMVRKVANSHTFSSQDDRNTHHYTEHHNTHTLNNVHK